MRIVDPVKHEQKKHEILKAAKKCFIQDGFSGASISRICAEAGVGAGHLYHYFESKESILAAITEAALADASEQFKQVMDGPDAIVDLITKIEKAKERKLGKGYIRFLLELFAEADRNPAIAKILQRHTQGMISILSDFLKEGQAKGHIALGLEPDMAAAVIISVIDGSKIMAIRNPAMNRDGFLELTLLLISRFLKPHESSKIDGLNN